MTLQDNDTADIAWMRRLAEEGGQSPYRGASIQFAAGLIYGLASLAHGLVVTGLVAAPPAAIAVIWLGATVVFLAIMTLLSVRMARDPAPVTAANRAARAVWTGVGWGVFALFAALWMVIWRTGQAGTEAFLLVPSIIMVFYGMGWAVTGAMMRNRALTGLAVASFAAAPLLGLFAGTGAQYWGYALALFGLMALPAFIMMRQSAKS